MIQVEYNKNLKVLTVTGHAGAGKKGEDLVCSAASILVHTLAANVEHMADAGIVDSIRVEVREGDAKISCRARYGNEHTVANTFESVCVGFEILASKFPEYISYIIFS